MQCTKYDTNNAKDNDKQKEGDVVCSTYRQTNRSIVQLYLTGRSIQLFHCFIVFAMLKYVLDVLDVLDVVSQMSRNVHDVLLNGC